MVVYGFLSYYKGKVYIPNKELMDTLVGISYKKAEKIYQCRVETLHIS